MPRARHPLPPELRSLQFNPVSNRYVITENGITYFLTLEHTRLIKDFLRGDSSATVEAWFNKLDKKTMKEVYREGIEITTVIYYDGSPQEG